MAPQDGMREPYDQWRNRTEESRSQRISGTPGRRPKGIIGPVARLDGPVAPQGGRGEGTFRTCSAIGRESENLRNSWQHVTEKKVRLSTAGG